MGSRSTLRPRLVAFAAAAALATATITSCVNVTPAGNAAFVDVLARDVRGGQAPPWVRDDALRQLAAGTSRSKVVDAAIASQDAHDTVIQDAFRTVLGHPPTFDEESTWLPRLGAAQHESDLYVSILASDELYAQVGGTNAAVVDRVAELVVGHPLAEAQRADAIAELDAGGSRQSFVRSLWTSADAAGHRVDDTYERLLGRAPTVDERFRWTNALTSQDTSSLMSALASSNEYYAHAAQDLTRLVVDTAQLRVGTVGVPYDTELAAFGGTAPYQWAIDGAPSWVQLAGSILSGMPSAAQNSTVTLTVTDADGRTATRDVALQVAAASPAFVPFQTADATSDWHGTLTEDGGDQYSFTFGGGRLSVEAAASNHGTNLRTVIVPTNGQITQDGQSCATWTAQSTQQLQQGAALQVRADDTGRIRTLTVTKNIIFYAVWGFHFHTWDTDRSQPFDQFGEFDLSRTFQRLDLGAPLPWSMCARVLDHDLEFKAWPAGEPEPAWGDPRYGGRAPIPDGWDVAGQIGWYVGHVPPGGSATLDDLTAGTYDSQPPAAPQTAPGADARIGTRSSGLLLYSDPGPVAGAEQGP